MPQKVSIDPFTRIEGHLAISLEVEDNFVTDAKCIGEMFRGFEKIMQGRSPLDAQQIMQRICGICPVSHGLASALAQEAAYNLEVPDNGRLIRNIMLAANYYHNNVTHFYHLSAMDFVDIKGIMQYQGKDRMLLGIKDWVDQEMKSKSLFPAAPFLPRFETRYIEDPEVNITALKNYFLALEVRATAHQIVAIFAGKMPHMASNVPGGVTEQVTSKKIALCRSKTRELREFLDAAYINDVLAVAGEFPDYWQIGKSCGNYLSFGSFPQSNGNREKVFEPGVLINGTFSEVNIAQITEQVKYAKYTSDSGMHTTKPDPKKSGAYSWIKAPRYQEEAMEVGPLARVMIAYARPGNSPLKETTEQFLRQTGKSLEDLDSCMGRHAVRIIELQVLLDKMETWIEMLDPTKPACADFDIPATGEGVGLTEAPRGALGHWLTIENSRVKGYECIVPTTWNCSPKDDKGVPGPVEQALMGTYVQDRHNPMEAARIVRAFDPCLACAVH
jgi:ferredoxin hydrogenase large subunit/hydrogenase large subunit